MAIFNCTQDMLSPCFYFYVSLFSTSSSRWSTFEVFFIQKTEFFPTFWGVGYNLSQCFVSRSRLQDEHTETRRITVSSMNESLLQIIPSRNLHCISCTKYSFLHCRLGLGDHFIHGYM